MFPQHLVGPELSALPAVQHMLRRRVHACTRKGPQAVSLPRVTRHGGHICQPQTHPLTSKLWLW